MKCKETRTPTTRYFLLSCTPLFMTGVLLLGFLTSEGAFNGAASNLALCVYSFPKLPYTVQLACFLLVMFFLVEIFFKEYEPDVSEGGNETDQIISAHAERLDELEAKVARLRTKAE